MSMKPGSIIALGLMLIVVILIGGVSIMYIGGFGPFAKPVSPTLPGTCQYGGTWPNCNTGPSGQVQKYAGSVSFLITPIWAYDGAASNEGSNDPTYNFYHADKSLIGAETISSHVPAATTLTVSPGDNAIVYLGVLYSSSAQTYIVDPAMTVAQNALWIKSYSTNTDLDHNGQYELLFKLDLSSIVYNIGQTPTVQINLYTWKVDTATVTSLSNPTFSVAAGGDLDITGYMLYGGGAGYVLPVAQVNVWWSQAATANTTGLAAVQAASGFWLVSLRFTGVGAVTNTVYGTTWAAPTYDPSNTRYVMYQANDAHDGAPGTIDVHQPTWAMQMVYERGSGATWLQFDIKCHASPGALTASKVYYVYLEFLVLTSTGSSASEGLKTSITTTA